MKLNLHYKETPEDFLVEEIPLYSFTGKGQHLIIKIEKKNLTTLDVVKRISKTFKIKEKLIGYAGLKDKRSISIQYISIPYEKELENNLHNIEDDNLRILDTTRHKNKLKPGHLKGNIFEIKIKTDDKKQLLKRLEKIQTVGFPNFFDSQRFSSNNFELGMKLLKGEKVKASPYKIRLFISAVSSKIFNLYVLERIKKGKFLETIEGDIVKNIKGKDIPTGPILGYKMPEPQGESFNFERKILETVGIRKEDFKPFKSKGTRRIIRTFPEIYNVSCNGEKIILKLFLPKGSFATVLLKELSESIL